MTTVIWIVACALWFYAGWCWCKAHLLKQSNRKLDEAMKEVEEVRDGYKSLRAALEHRGKN